MSDQPFVRADVSGFLQLLAAGAGEPLETLPPSVGRKLFDGLAAMAELPRGELAEVRELAIPGENGHLVPARLYRANLLQHPAPVLLFFHGGGWVLGGLESHDSACAEIARSLGLDVVAVDYRLAPEHPFPAAIEDCMAAARWLAGSPGEIGHPVSGLVPAGDSAGGNLAAVVSQQSAGQLAVPVIAQWLIYPAVDMRAEGGSMASLAQGYFLTSATIQWFGECYLGDPANRDNPLASPHAAASVEGLPPTLLCTCGLDPLRDQGRAYAARLIAAGVRTVFREAEGQIHGWLTLRGAIPSAGEDLAGNLAALAALIEGAKTS